MNKKVSLLMGMVLTTILALSIVPSAFATQWLQYDDGTVEGSYFMGDGGHMAVKFSLPSGWSGARITRIAYYIHSTSSLASFDVWIADGACTQALYGPFTTSPTATGTWFIIDITDTTVIGDFYVTIQYFSGNQPLIGVDTNDPDLRSYTGSCSGWTTYASGDFMIRAEVDPYSPVGGVVYSLNKLSLLSPLLMVTGLIGAIVIGSFAIKKCRILFLFFSFVS